MRKGEKRFEDLLLTCLFPKGVPAGHREALKKHGDRKSLRDIHEHGKALAEHHGIELMDDIDEEVVDEAGE